MLTSVLLDLGIGVAVFLAGVLLAVPIAFGLAIVEAVVTAILGPKDKDIVPRPIEAPVARKPDPAVTSLKAELQAQFAVEEELLGLKASRRPGRAGA